MKRKYVYFLPTKWQPSNDTFQYEKGDHPNIFNNL